MTLLDTPPQASTAANPELLFREAKQRRRRRWLVAGIVATALIVALLSIVLLGRTAGPGRLTHGTDRAPTPVGKVNPLPKQMVMVSLGVGQQNLEVVSSASGHVVRKLTSAVGSFDGTTQPTVSPAGTVYFDHAGRAGSQPSEQIWSIPLSGGPSTFVADGHTPVVSPNGAFLAYLTWTALNNAPASVVVMTIATGATNKWIYSTNVPEISDLSWAPDSQSLVFTTSAPTSTSWTYGAWSVRLLSPNRSLDTAQAIRLLPNAFWVGYVNANQAMEVLVHRNFLDQGDWFQPILMDVASGQVIKRLPVLAGQSEAPPNGSGQWQIDPTGHYVAFIKQRSLPNGAGAVTDLYRWSIEGSPKRSTSRPTIVKSDVWSPAWVPGS